MMKRFASCMLACMLVCVLGLAAADVSYEGTVVGGETIAIQAPFGGRISDNQKRAGDMTRKESPDQDRFHAKSLRARRGNGFRALYRGGGQGGGCHGAVRRQPVHRADPPLYNYSHHGQGLPPAKTATFTWESGCTCAA